MGKQQSPQSPKQDQEAKNKDVVERTLTFVKEGGMMGPSKPGFAHAMKLSFHTIDKNRLSWDESKKALTYRYKFDKDIPKPTLGLLTAFMDELSTCACFGVGLPSRPGTTLQMQAELVQTSSSTNPLKDIKEIDIVNTVTKLGRTVANTVTNFYDPKTGNQLVCFSSQVKYMPAPIPLFNFLLSKRGYFIFQLFSRCCMKPPGVYEEKNLLEQVIGSNLEFNKEVMGKATFQITDEHTNPFGMLHGACQAILMETVGETFVKEKCQLDEVLLEAMQIDFVSSSKKTVDIECQVIGVDLDKIHVRVHLKNPINGRIVSDGKLRFSNVAALRQAPGRSML